MSSWGWRRNSYIGVESGGLVMLKSQTGVLNLFWVRDAFEILIKVKNYLSRNKHDT